MFRALVYLHQALAHHFARTHAPHHFARTHARDSYYKILRVGAYIDKRARVLRDKGHGDIPSVCLKIVANLELKRTGATKVKSCTAFFDEIHKLDAARLEDTGANPY